MEFGPEQQSADSKQRAERVLHGIVANPRHPELDQLIADEAWKQLDPARQDVISAIAQREFPDDLEGRAGAIRVKLLSDHDFSEVEVAEMLEGMYSGPDAA